MALTDADRLQMTAMALMRYSVVTTGGGGGTTYYPFTPNKTIRPIDGINLSYSYAIS